MRLRCPRVLAALSSSFADLIEKVADLVQLAERLEKGERLQIASVRLLSVARVTRQHSQLSQRVRLSQRVVSLARNGQTALQDVFSFRVVAEQSMHRPRSQQRLAKLATIGQPFADRQARGVQVGSTSEIEELRG